MNNLNLNMERITRNSVVLVDEEDNTVGVAPKLEAHLQGLRHRAFSVQLINDQNELLIQRRAMSKYHSPGLWTNSCCSHPQEGEDVLIAAEERLFSEMGVRCTLTYIDKFTYRAELANDLIEFEVDHVFWGRYNGEVAPDAEEVDTYRWISVNALEAELERYPENFTYWFPYVLRLLKEKVDSL